MKNTHLTRWLAGVVLAGALSTAGLTAGLAGAADPAQGTVSKAAPHTTWKGQTTGSYFVRAPTAVSGSGETPCETPTCDAYTLKVADSDRLTVGQTMGSTSSTAAITIRIKKPDGSVVQANSDPGAPASGKYFKVVIPNAPTGDYEIQHYNNSTGAMTYESYAGLGAAGASHLPPSDGDGGGGGGGPAPAPGPAPLQPATLGPSPAPTQAIALTVKVGKASARKLKKTRKLTATVTVSRQVSSITAAFKKGKKVVAKGRLGATSGTRKLTVKISKKAARKLKKGAYLLTVVAADGKTSTIRTVKVKVRK